MATVILEHWLENYDKWIEVYSEHGPARVAAGMGSARVHQDIKDPDHVYVIKDDVDLAAFQAFMDDPELSDLLQSAGVQDMKIHIIGEGSVHDG